MKFLEFSVKLTPPTAALALILALTSACTVEHPKGSPKNPITVSLLPSKDTRSLLTSGTSFKNWMEKETGLSFDVQVPHSYVAVVEALGSQRADMAYLNTINFLLAEEKYKAEPIFISLGQTGKTRYRGQFITHKDSGLNSLKEIQGKKMAYVDPTSASGYYLPAYQLLQLGVEPKQVVFAGKHDSAVIMVYQKQVDAAATYFAESEDHLPNDARRLVSTQYPDVFEKVKVLDYTIEFPNDAFVLRHDLESEIKLKIKNAMIKWAQSPEGLKTLKDLNKGTGLRTVESADYIEARELFKTMRTQLFPHGRK